MIFDFILRIIFVTNFHYRVDFIIRFDSNYDIRFNNNKFCFDDKTIIYNLFDFNDKIYDRFNRIDFDLMSQFNQIQKFLNLTFSFRVINDFHKHFNFFKLI